MKCDKFVVNAAGRRVPTVVNGKEMGALWEWENISLPAINMHRPSRHVWIIRQMEIKSLIL